MAAAKPTAKSTHAVLEKKLSSRSATRRERDLLACLRAAAAQVDGDDNQKRLAVLEALKKFLAQGRAEARQGLENKTLKGAQCAEYLSALQDDLLRALAAYIETDVLYLSNPTEAEKVTVLAVGGYGRGRLAPSSDIDLLFLLPYKRNAASESFVELMLYMLWDLGLKVGHATRTIADCLIQAEQDFTIRTAMLEKRFLWGSAALYLEFKEKFSEKIVANSAPEFVTAKLAERDARHLRAGQSRYLVEPNLKESKGGLRDLNTLFWIARYSYQIDELNELVALDVLTPAELRLFRRCDHFLWEVRCHLHFMTGRAEERLSFDVQKPLSAHFEADDSAGMKSVEKFMRRYFLVAKNIGDLTAIFCASLEEQQKKPPSRVRLPAIFRRNKKVDGFLFGGGRLTMTDEDCFEKDPVNLIRVFHLADKFNLNIHPDTMRAITRAVKFVNKDLRANEQANVLFLEILTSRKNPERTLRRMNEAGVLGRFIPDFGRIVALMQFNMYHHYTADEHLLRAIGLLREIESGAQAEAHPLAYELMKTGKVNRRVLYLATLLHDIAKGRPEDHSVAGARIARTLGPRLGFSKAETRLTEWLVREHLVMSDVAQRRDLSDPRTIEDFTASVGTTERLEHLFILTEVDIKAVGPGVFNGWKAQLLRELYDGAKATLNGMGYGAQLAERADAAKQAFVMAHAGGWSAQKYDAYVARHLPAYWVGFSVESQLRHAAMIEEMGDQSFMLDVSPDPMRDCSEVTFIAQDHPGLFARITGACAVAELSILDARISTTQDGLAIDALHVKRPDRSGPLEAAQVERFKNTLLGVMNGSIAPPEHLPQGRRNKQIEAFDLAPEVDLRNDLSDDATVIEVSGLDRPGLLYALARTFVEKNVSVSAARIATFGERAVDAFYAHDLTGGKIASKAKREAVTEALLLTISDPVKSAKPRRPSSAAARKAG
jgi:[protein-PII] uridylyltransferase